MCAGPCLAAALVGERVRADLNLPGAVLRVRLAWSSGRRCRGATDTQAGLENGCCCCRCRRRVAHKSQPAHGCCRSLPFPSLTDLVDQLLCPPPPPPFSFLFYLSRAHRAVATRQWQHLSLLSQLHPTFPLFFCSFHAVDSRCCLLRLLAQRGRFDLALFTAFLFGRCQDPAAKRCAVPEPPRHREPVSGWLGAPAGTSSVFFLRFRSTAPCFCFVFCFVFCFLRLVPVCLFGKGANGR